MTRKYHQPSSSNQIFSSVLKKSFYDYLQYLTTFGYRSETPRPTLAAFEQYLIEQNVRRWRDVTSEIIQQWQSWMGPTSEYQTRYRLVMLDGFFRFLLGQEAIQSSPMPEIPPYHRHSKPPYVFSREDIKRLLNAAARLPDHHKMPYRGPTYRMVFLLLYTLGLRISEALNLRIRDIDFVEDSITIVNTKFNKGRVLPFGPNIKAVLTKYLNEHPLLVFAVNDAYIFQTASENVPHLYKQTCYDTLTKITKKLGIVNSAETRFPNLHSLRHSFAVHRMERWLREQIDIGLKLPLLSAFMGHVNIEATQIYLSMTPERLRLIGERFEDAYGKEG